MITAVPYRHLICKNIILSSVPLINVNTAVTECLSVVATKSSKQEQLLFKLLMQCATVSDHIQ